MFSADYLTVSKAPGVKPCLDALLDAQRNISLTTVSQESHAAFRSHQIYLNFVMFKSHWNHKFSLINKTSKLHQEI